jgi:sugar lactone lactonase YvrE
VTAISQVDLVFDAHADLAEGPLWDGERGALWWVDVLAGRINCLELDPMRNHVIEIGQPVSALGHRADGTLVVAVQSGLAVLDPQSGNLDLRLPLDEGRPRNRFNDGKVDRRGRFWAGTMDFDAAPGHGTLYRLDSGWRLEPALGEVTISNGLDWSPDDRLMFYVDTATQRVDMLDFDAESGAISGRRAFAEVPRAEGTPDGLAVDLEGGVWVAIFYAGAVYHFDPSGRRIGEIRLPVSAVSSCAFGGPKLDELFITTARAGLGAEELVGQRHAGAIFRVEVDTPGQPPNCFAG